MIRKIILATAFTLMAWIPSKAQDSIRTSLVTCAPGTLVYEVYGHTAIRVENLDNGSDLAFNYGLFDFSSPHFIWRWLLGKTDYLLGAQRFQGFLKEYDERGSSVYVQPLNLSEDGHRALASALLENALPENRTYRYNFLYRNCASEVLDKIIENADGQVTLAKSDTIITFRQLLHKYNSVEPWNEFGVDLIVGAEADRPITERQASFAPMCLMEMVQSAQISDTAGVLRPLVTECQEIKPSGNLEFTKPILTPLQVMILFFLFTLLVCCYEWCSMRRIWGYDIFILGLQGITGILIAFLFFFSEHPAVGSNWLIICLNPLPLIFLPFAIRRIRNKKNSWFMLADFIILTAFICCYKVIPQYISPATLVMLATFALRTLMTTIITPLAAGGWFKPVKRGSPTKKMFLLSISLLAVPAMASASNDAQQTPKLVVGIVIDQLDGDILQELMPVMGDDGFKLLWTGGYNRTDTYFEFDGADRASAMASVYTGTVPFYHGIVGEKWLDRKTGSLIGAVDDSQESGINTIYRSSPKRLAVSTLTDMMYLCSDGAAIICSVAAERDAAVLAAGHEADAVMWMNESDGQWAGSGYYGGLPYWTIDANMEPWQKSEWRPVFPTGAYVNKTGKPFETFTYSFSRGDTQNFKTSPLANDKVTEMAIRSLEKLAPDMKDSPSLLAVTLYAGGLCNKKAGINSLELQDCYIRLDQNIADLIRGTEQIMGKGNTLYFLTSTGYADAPAPDLNGTRIPTGTVSMPRVAALLNLYLSALHEQGEYVTGCYGPDIYLDRRLIEDNNLSLRLICEECEDLLLQMAGIRNVLTQREMISGNLDQGTLHRRNAVNADCSGDLIIEVSPGWTVTDDMDTEVMYSTLASHTFPAILYGAGIRAEINHEPISASFIVPTICNILGIDSPAACSTHPVSGLR